jgi:hypothetical protein
LLVLSSKEARAERKQKHPDVRFDASYIRAEQEHVQDARSTELKAYEGRVDKKIGPEKIEHPNVPCAACEQACGVCGSFDVYTDWMRDFNICGEWSA